MILIGAQTWVYVDASDNAKHGTCEQCGQACDDRMLCLHDSGEMCRACFDRMFRAVDPDFYTVSMELA